MTREEYKTEIIKFLGEDGLNYLKEFYDKDKLILPWGLILYGGVGMQVRNYLRSNHPEIDKEFPDYADFEDFSYDLIQEIMKEYGVEKV